MKERPILFSGPMVRALLNGSKTQTRRVVKPQPVYDGRFAGGWKLDGKKGHEAATCSPLIAELCPYGQPGDRLWVREAHALDRNRVFYRANHAEAEGSGPRVDIRWKPSIHMPRWASRITLEVTGVQVERLQNISEADCIAEGCTKNHNNYYRGGPHKAGGLKQMATAKKAYQDLWESINGPGSWEANPWVWVVVFKRVEGGAARAAIAKAGGEA